ncbi:hypothetical protein GCM10023319_52640 [Nocardia iowensis]
MCFPQAQLRHMHRGFGDPVHIHQGWTAGGADRVPRLQVGVIQRFATEYHHAQGGIDSAGHRSSFGQRVESRRGLIQDRHPVADDEIPQLRGRAHHVPRHDDDPAAVQERTPDLPDRKVERLGMTPSPDIVGIEFAPRRGTQEKRCHIAVGDGNTLRRAGGTGRVDEIREIAGQQRSGPRYFMPIYVGLVDQDKGNSVVRERFRGGDVGEDRDRCGIAEDESQPLGGISRIDRQISTTGLQHRQYRDNQLR